LFSCSEGEEKKVKTEDKKEEEVIDTLTDHQKYQVELSDWYDTNLVGGYYLKHILDDSNWVHMYWGGPDFERMEITGSYPDYRYYFEVDFPNYIGMKGVCGSPCWGLTLLPKNASDTSIRYDYPLSYQPRKNRILHKPIYFEPELAIVNVETRKTQVFKIDEMSTGMDFMSLYDSSFFIGDSLYIKWNTGYKTKVDEGSREFAILVFI
jgi:hypothetical protein